MVASNLVWSVFSPTDYLTTMISCLHDRLSDALRFQYKIGPIRNSVRGLLSDYDKSQEYHATSRCLVFTSEMNYMDVRESLTIAIWYMVGDLIAWRIANSSPVNTLLVQGMRKVIESNYFSSAWKRTSHVVVSFGGRSEQDFFEGGGLN